MCSGAAPAPVRGPRPGDSIIGAGDAAGRPTRGGTAHAAAAGERASAPSHVAAGPVRHRRPRAGRVRLGRCAGQRQADVVADPAARARPATATRPTSASPPSPATRYLVSPRAAASQDGLLDAERSRPAPRFPADRVDYGPVIPFKNRTARPRPGRTSRPDARQRLRDALRRVSAPTKRPGWTTTPCSWRSRTQHGGAAGTTGPTSCAAASRRRSPRRAARRWPTPSACTSFGQFLFFRQWQRAASDYAHEQRHPHHRRHPDLRRRRLAPTSGPTRSCSSSTTQRRPTRRRRRAARLLQRRPASSGATRSTTGTRWQQTGYRLVDRPLPGDARAWSTWSASTTSAASRRTGRSRPASRPPINGRWVQGAGRGAVRQRCKRALGELADHRRGPGRHHAGGRRAARRSSSLPGMRDPAVRLRRRRRRIRFLPHNYDRNTVVYTGTHDNDTTRGWYRIDAGAASATTCAATWPATAATSPGT